MLILEGGGMACCIGGAGFYYRTGVGINYYVEA